jgi:hypothetical protein
MAMATKTVFVFVFVASFILLAQGQTAEPAKPAPEETSFDENETPRHTVSLSPDVLKVLLQTKEAKEAWGDLSKEQQKNPAQLFVAAEVHLSKPDQVDLVVRGIFPFSGADNSWFWIVSSVNNVPKVVLWTGALSLEMMNSRANGYRNIRSYWGSSGAEETKEFHFNGEEYKLWKSKSKDRSREKYP